MLDTYGTVSLTTVVPASSETIENVLSDRKSVCECARQHLCLLREGSESRNDRGGGSEKEASASQRHPELILHLLEPASLERIQNWKEAIE